MPKTIEEQEQEQQEFDAGVLGAIDEGIVNADTSSIQSSEPDEVDLGLDAESDATDETVEIESVDDEPEIPAESEDQTPGDSEAEDDKGSPPAALAESSDEEVSPGDHKKPSDEFGELPEGTKKETSERFSKMKSRFDEVSDQLETVTGQNQKWMETITSTKATPEQFGETLAFLSDWNSGTPEGLNRAYDALQNQLALLGKQIGREAPGVDPLDDYPELKQQVEDGYIDRTNALELAQARAAKKFSEASRERMDADAQSKDTQDEALEGIAELGSRLRSANVAEFNAKSPALNAIMEAVIRSGAHPSTWVPSVESAYKKLPYAAQPSPPKPKPKAVNPMRPTGSPGTGGNLSKEPGTIEEALDMALGI